MWLRGSPIGVCKRREIELGDRSERGGGNARGGVSENALRPSSTYVIIAI